VWPTEGDAAKRRPRRRKEKIQTIDINNTMFEVNHQSPTSLGAQPTADATTRLSIQARSWRQYLVSAALLAALFGAPAAVPTAAQVRPKSATHQQARPVGGKRIIRGTSRTMPATRSSAHTCA